MKRCPKGTRKNKEGMCVKKYSPSISPLKVKRCPNGTRKNKKGVCEKKMKNNSPKTKTQTKTRTMFVNISVKKGKKSSNMVLGPFTDKKDAIQNAVQWVISPHSNNDDIPLEYVKYNELMDLFIDEGLYDDEDADEKTFKIFYDNYVKKNTTTEKEFDVFIHKYTNMFDSDSSVKTTIHFTS